MPEPLTCVICGGPNDTRVYWRSYCSMCADHTWGPGVVSNLIEMLANCHDRLAEAQAKLRALGE